MPVASLQALLGRIIDYAGLFPPARLDMLQTVRHYAEFLAGPEAWMLGRLILPVARFDEFEREARDYLPSARDADPWLISALTAAAGDGQLATDLDAIAEFNERHADPALGLAAIDVVELKGDSADVIDAALDVIPGELFPFFEMPVAVDPRGLLATVAGLDAGAKVRTGGITADAVPSVENLARFIAACAAAAVPFKATAGLHHPLRHMNRDLGGREFGFLNVFLAGCLGEQHELSEEVIVELLNDESIACFRFDNEEIQWREHRMNVAQVEEARDFFVVSFGSCSIDEPRDHLRALRLLEP